METYRVRYASSARHEHWYQVDTAGLVHWSTCFLTEPHARCVAPYFTPGVQFRYGRYTEYVAPSRIPRYIQQRLTE